jgi:Tol biopolymer transport system component
VEIKTTAALQHPHILPLFDSGEADSFLYYVMPFIDGETLRTKLDRETQLGIDEAVGITTAVADALDYAHRHGVIHRDIKPENILLHDGRPMVADFGIALALSAAAGGRMTETGMSLGTPHYMSPEQATAEKDITARSDVYSLGSVLYEMLTGNPPHTGASAQQIIMKIVTEEAAPVTKLRKAVPPNVAAAVAKSLEKLPADRFESAKSFAEALNNAAFTTTTFSGATAAARSPRWKPALVAGLVLGALAGAAVVWMLAPAGSSTAEQGREQLTFNGVSRRPAISPAGDFVAFVERTCEHAEVGNCRSSLQIQEVGSTQSRALLRDALSLESPRWSHDGQTIVVAGQLDGERQGLFAIPRLSGTPQLLGPLGAYDTHPSADSVLLVPTRAAGSDVALVIDLRTGTVADSFPVPFHRPYDIAWSPDARHIAATTTRDGGLAIVDRQGSTTATLAITAREFLRWSVDGTSLLFFKPGKVREDEFLRLPVSRDGTIQGPPKIVMKRIPTLFEGQFDIARRTGRMVIGTGDALIDIWSFDLGVRPVRSRRETRGTTWYGSPALSNDGASIFYYRGDALGDNVYMLNRATGDEEALTAREGPGANAVAFSPDGRRLAYARLGDDRPLLEYIDFPSRKGFSGPANIATNRVVPLLSGGFLVKTPDRRTLAILDSLGGTLTPIALADSLDEGDRSYAPSPDGESLAIVATRSGTRQLSLEVISLASGDVQILGVLEPDEVSPSLTWDRDGTIYLGRWLMGEGSPSVWRYSSSSRALSRMATLPVPCILWSFSVGALGQMATCSTRDFRGDIWLIDAGDLTR